jgi:hypothetical protein
MTTAGRAENNYRPSNSISFMSAVAPLIVAFTVSLSTFFFADSSELGFFLQLQELSSAKHRQDHFGSRRAAFYTRNGYILAWQIRGA